MTCKKFNIIEKVEEMLNTSLLPYQKQTMKISICNQCNKVKCNQRLADETTLLKIGILPRRLNTMAYIHLLESIAEAQNRTAPPNVLK